MHRIGRKVSGTDVVTQELILYS